MFRKHDTDVTFLGSAMRAKLALGIRGFSTEVSASPPPLAVAFAGIFFGGFALTFALFGCEPVSTAVALVITTYCAGEFILDGDAGVLD